MPNTIAGAEAYARTHPYRDGGSWAGWCASFCYRAGAFSRSFVSAMAAGDYVAGSLRGDWQNAPRGAIHYWAGVGGYGHCAFDLGNNILLMASSAVTTRFGADVGTISFQDYARKGIPYRGWSMRWGNETLSGGSTAGGGYDSIEDDMTPEQDAILRNIAGFLYAGGTDVAKPTYYGVPGTIYHLLKSPVFRQVNGKLTPIPQIQDNADTNTLVRQLLARPAAEVTLSEEDKADIAQLILDGLPEQGASLTKQDIADVLTSVTFGVVEE